MVVCGILIFPSCVMAVDDYPGGRNLPRVTEKAAGQLIAGDGGF
jgi:hypothetical protein